ncbi:MAG TPA: diguanylate cyclase [Rhodocyclaceae bacterium]|nr:diguanylate cyclase [Rhodocyclaceae bacterium]
MQFDTSSPVRATSRNSLQSWPLGRLLTVVFVGAVLGLSLLMLFMAERLQSESLREEIGLGLESTAQYVEGRISSRLTERILDIYRTPYVNLLRDPHASYAEQLTALEALQRRHAGIAWFGLTGPDGRVKVGTSSQHEGQDVSQKWWWYQAKDRARIVDPDFVRGNPRTLDEARAALDYGLPLLDRKANFMGMLVISVSTARARLVAADLASELGAQLGVEVLVLRHNGDVLVGPPDAVVPPSVARSLGSEEDYEVTRGERGKEFITTAASDALEKEHPGLGWTVVVRKDANTALAPLRSMRWTIAALGGLACLLTAALAWFFARRVARPLSQLCAAADTLRDKHEGCMPILNDYREVQHLSQALRAFSVDMESRVNERTQALHDANDALLRAMHNETATTETLREREKLLRRSQDELHTIADNVPALVFYLDTEHRIRYANALFREWLGLDPNAIVGRLFDDFTPRVTMEIVTPYLARTLAGERCSFELFGHLGRRHYNVSLMPYIEEGAVQGVIGVAQDISVHKQQEAKLTRVAMHDSLTGLPNRRMLEAQLPTALARSKRQNKAVAVLFLDLDGFKGVNDLHGHAAGDAVLREFAARICATVRQSDITARLGGDEFVALEGLGDGVEGARRVADKLLTCMSRPFVIGQHEVMLGTSIGIVVHQPGTQTSPGALLEEADHAMYLAKRAGKNRYELASPKQAA